MSWRGLVAIIAVVVSGAACSDSTQQSPATAPSTVAVPTTMSPTTTVATTVPASTANTAPTPEETRLAEIEAIFRDLEYRRLDALYRNDEGAYRAVFSSPGYLQQGLDLEFGSVEFVAAPSSEEIEIVVLEILSDTGDCVAAVVDLDLTSALGPEAIGSITKIISRTNDDPLRIAYAGDDWRCEGPHPLDG